MIMIDGSQGEGGGQIFRTSLTLAMCLGKAVCIDNIRAGRKKPGLLRQHLTCLKAAKTICGATVTGEVLGSQKVTFIPGKIKAGEYVFSVGSAGSTTLIFQTIFPALALQNEISDLVLEGGTHNGMAPSFDFIKACFIPAVNRMGYKVECDIERYGFYPSGGGRWRARIYPNQGLSSLQLMERGEVRKEEVVVTQANIPERVADSILAYIKEKAFIKDENLKKKMVQSVGPGNILSVRLAMDHVTEVFESIGERGLRAETVVNRAVEQFRKYLCATAPVGEYLADQLVVPMILGGGGRFRACEYSEHLNTNISVVKQLTGVNIDVKKENQNDWTIQVI